LQRHDQVHAGINLQKRVSYMGSVVFHRPMLLCQNALSVLTDIHQEEVSKYVAKTT